MIEKSKKNLFDLNVDIEEWDRLFDEDFQRFCEEEKKRMEEQDLVYGIIYDNEEYDVSLNYTKASFELKREDLKDYVYVDKLSSCKEGCEDDYINRTYKFIRMEDEYCAIFYRDY